jgi:hypothetical protein
VCYYASRRLLECTVLPGIVSAVLFSMYADASAWVTVEIIDDDLGRSGGGRSARLTDSRAAVDFAACMRGDVADPLVGGFGRRLGFVEAVRDAAIGRYCD